MILIRCAALVFVAFLPAFAVETPRSLTVDYPLAGTLFPPDLAPPTFLWHDRAPATSWRVELTFESGSAPLRLATAGPRARVGPVDEDCVSTTNKLPEVDRTQRTWQPAVAEWNELKRRASTAPVTLVLSGVAAGRVVSRGTVRFAISGDPVGAPIFYRDVPLMPTETEPGVIKPLAPYAVRLVNWRVKNVSERTSRVVMSGMPVCANCHSFSRDGRAMGMDLDGLHNNKGRYFIAPIHDGKAEVRSRDVVQWSTAEGRLRNSIRVGFMSQIAPDASTVVTSIDVPGARGSNYYVANFSDYRFLQVFFPTRGILAWFNRATQLLEPLPGADDPAYVHFGAVWSADGKTLVFARAKAREPADATRPAARYANDPNELQIQYDLYRIPFNAGRGGVAEPIVGASANGKSNTFPKLSPDGRWLVYVQARNGQLMRPDSELYIVAASGGVARRMRCNTSRMNSWHSFSPNGRWLVFSSKARSPYTQLYLTHIDDEGNDTPPVLIENTQAANRAANIPEFLHGDAQSLAQVGGDALDYYRRFDRAMFFYKRKRYDEAVAAWRAVLEIAPGDADVTQRLGMSLLLAGHRKEALPYLEKTRARTPLDNAIEALEKGRDAALDVVEAKSADEHYYVALRSLRARDAATALDHLKRCVELRPNHIGALRRAAWILATNDALRNGDEAERLIVRAMLAQRTNDAATLEVLAAAYAAKLRFADAVATVRRALALQPANAAKLEQELHAYEASKRWSE